MPLKLRRLGGCCANEVIRNHAQNGREHFHDGTPGPTCHNICLDIYHFLITIYYMAVTVPISSRSPQASAEMQVKFISLEEKGTSAQIRAIRSHAAVQHNLRRKEARRQKALQALPSINSLCTCDFVPDSLPPGWAEGWSSIPDTPRPRKASRVEEKKQRLADSYKLCVQCKKLQFGELSRVSQVAVMRMLSPHIAAFCQAEFDPFGILPESPWHMNPGEQRELNEVKYFIITFYAPGNIRKFTIPEAIQDPGLYMAMVFCGYAYLYGRRGMPMSNTAVAIKLEAIRHINRKLRDPKLASAPSTIASIAYLATAVRNFGGGSAADEVAAHESGIDELVKLREGRLASLDDTPFGSALRNILIMHHIVYAGLSATEVSPTFVVKVPVPSPPLSNTEYLPESPFYRPRSSFFSLEGARHCGRATLEILYDMDDLFTKLLARSENGASSEESYQTQLLTIYTRISNLQSTVKQPNEAASRIDHYYDAVRICALITLDAMVHSRALCHSPNTLVRQLIESLKRTDIGNAWGDMLGVLYWITITGTAACPLNPGHQFLDSTFGKAQFELCYTTKRYEARIKPAQKFAVIHLAIVKGPSIQRMGSSRGSPLSLSYRISPPD